MSDLQTYGRRLAALKVLEDLVKDEKTSTRGGALTAMREIGVEKLRVSLGDSDLGTVSVTSGRQTWTVANDTQLKAWLREHAPHALVETIDPIWLRGIDKWIEANGGEVPPGVELRQGDPYPTVRLAQGAREVILAAVRSGEIPALPGGGE